MWMQLTLSLRTMSQCDGHWGLHSAYTQPPTHTIVLCSLTQSSTMGRAGHQQRSKFESKNARKPFLKVQRALGNLTWGSFSSSTSPGPNSVQRWEQAHFKLLMYDFHQLPARRDKD